MPNFRKFHTHPESADGDFYVVNGECISCGAPHAVAPDLIGWARNECHCIWKKQPETPGELEQAFAAFDASEVGCYRYAGTDSTIITRIGQEYCDQIAGVAEPREFPVHPLDLYPIPIDIQFPLTASGLSWTERLLQKLFGRLH